MKNNRGSLTITAIFTVLIFSLYGILLYARSSSSYIRQSNSIETIQKAYAQDVPNSIDIAKQLEASEPKIDEFYTVTIDPKNGTGIQMIHIIPGDLIEKPKNPEKIGFSFENWYYINSNGEEEVFNFTVAPTGNINIFAKYSE